MIIEDGVLFGEMVLHGLGHSPSLLFDDYKITTTGNITLFLEGKSKAQIDCGADKCAFLRAFKIHQSRKGR